MASKALFHFACFACSTLLAAASALAQVQPEAVGGPVPDEGTRMMTPPVVSRILYAASAGEDVRQNFLAADLAAGAGYIDNALPYLATRPIADTTFSILPALSFDQSTTRQQETFTYSPGFTFYTPTAALDAFNQSAIGSFQRQLSPNISLSLNDSFLKTSNVFEGSYPFAGGGIGGSTQAPIPAIIAPFAEQMRNQANSTVTYQFSRNGMIGGGGSFSSYRYPNPADSAGLYNSDGSEGSFFYSRRVSRAQYLGVTYEYARLLVYPMNSQTDVQTHTLLPFYTNYFNRTLSFSIAVGAARADISQSQSTIWSPAVVASLGWQGGRGNLASNYLHVVASGAGLLGAYNSDSVNVSGGWKLSRTFTGGTSFSYQKIRPAVQLAGLTSQQGNNTMAQISLKHALTERINMEFGYQRLHEDFNGITAIAANPDVNREFVNVTYEFKKFLGR